MHTCLYLTVFFNTDKYPVMFNLHLAAQTFIGCGGSVTKAIRFGRRWGHATCHLQRDLHPFTVSAIKFITGDKRTLPNEWRLVFLAQNAFYSVFIYHI